MLEDGDTLKISETFSSIPAGRKFSLEAFEPFLETGIISTNLSTAKKTGNYDIIKGFTYKVTLYI